MDPWDSEFVYESDGKPFNIISLVADNEEGGEVTDADINYKDL
jgi:general secretion pathway protein G